MKLKSLLIAICSSLALSSSVTANAAIGWTEWIDKDQPGGTSDAETLPSILQSGSYPSVCSSPSKIEARYQTGGSWQTITPESASSAPNVFRFFNAVDGLQCYNADQSASNKPLCVNYQVRFYCETDAEDLSNKYPGLRQSDQQNAAYNQVTPGFTSDKPIKLARVARAATSTSTSAPPPPIIILDSLLRLGQGYDSLGNVYKNQCLNQNHPDFHIVSTPSSTGISSSVTYTASAAELYLAMDVREAVNAKGTFPVDGVDITLGFNHNHDRIQTRYLDESRMTFVARYRNIQRHYALVTQPRPIKDSVTTSLLRGTTDINFQKDFHKECGDRFLREAELGASLYIVFSLDKKKLRSSDINSVKATAEGAISKIFNVNGSVSDINEATSVFSKYQMRIEAYQAGGPAGLDLTGIQTNPASIPTVMKRFEDALAQTNPNLVAFNEKFDTYSKPSAYESLPDSAVFADTSLLQLNAARWSVLTGDFMAACNQAEELSQNNGRDLATGSCANKASAIAVLKAGLQDCIFPARWEKCVHPNEGGFDGSRYIVDRLSQDTPYYIRGSSTTDTVEKRFTKYWTCDYANITQCLPVRCLEDKGPSVNGKGYDVNLYAWNTAVGGSQNFNQDYYDQAGQRCVKADARICANNKSGARISFSLTTYHLCHSNRAFSVY